MLIFDITATNKTNIWLRQNNINLNALKYALTLLYADISPCSTVKKRKLVLQVDNNDSSGYVFGTDKIYLCSKPYIDRAPLKQKKFIIFLHFLHEFRHWMQSRVLGVKDYQLQYTHEDMQANNKKYRNDKFEIDASKFEKKYVRKFSRYYKEYLISYR